MILLGASSCDPNCLAREAKLRLDPKSPCSNKTGVVVVVASGVKYSVLGRSTVVEMEERMASEAVAVKSGEVLDLILGRLPVGAKPSEERGA